ncbi:MAG: hypothetical protein KatS3mg102_0428 [Planctomycetota bacterium]|nr:MAG: hypothetical protein KatS3mg102_0428 [Planctomycetota bacterium]
MSGSCPHPPHALGRAGEEAAARFLQARGLRVLERNLRTAAGELDLVCEAAEGTLVFVEVKARGPERSLEEALAAVTPARQRRLARAALAYMAERFGCERGARFDVVAVGRGEDGALTVLAHLEHAFSCDG